MNRSDMFYAVRMTAPQRKESYFPELEGDDKRLADEWLDGYLQLVNRIRREHLDRAPRPQSYPQAPVDDSSGTGTVRTATRRNSPHQ